MSGRRVLVVDRDPRNAKSLASTLGASGFVVRGCADARTAAAVADRLQPEVLVLDTQLPRKDAHALVQRIRARAAGRPVAVLYAVAPDGLAAFANNTCGRCEDFVVKPSTGGEIVARVHLLLSRTLSPTEPRTPGAANAQSPLAAVKRPRRLHLSVMFADVRGFTRFSETRDPETVASGLNDLFEYLATGVARFDGVVDKFLGDGMMAIFGLRNPKEHEMAAVFAAQEIMKSVNETQTSQLLTGERLTVGIGLHSGEAVVGPLGATFRRDATAVGNTVNLASRLCSEAQAGEILVSETTHEKVREAVEVAGIRTVLLKGMEKPQRIYSLRSA